MTTLAVLAAASDVAFYAKDTFWVAVALVIFLALLVYYGVPKFVGKALDDRAEGIRKNLEDARKMREDAQALLADYQRKASEAEEEAQKIIDQAKRESEALREESERKAAEAVARRVKLAEEKIARAERQAIDDVRGAAVDAAIKAAERLLGTKAAGDTGQRLIEKSISDVRAKLD